MQNSTVEQSNAIQELTLEQIECVTGGYCYTEYVWIEPQRKCIDNPWVGGSYTF